MEKGTRLKKSYHERLHILLVIVNMRNVLDKNLNEKWPIFDAGFVKQKNG